MALVLPIANPQVDRLKHLVQAILENCGLVRVGRVSIAKLSTLPRGDQGTYTLQAGRCQEKAKKQSHTQVFIPTPPISEAPPPPIGRESEGQREAGSVTLRSFYVET